MKVVLDIEDGIDPEMLLGTVVFEGGDQSNIVITDTYVEAWLISFIDFLSSENSGEGEVHIAEENDVINVCVREALITLKYKSQLVSYQLSDFLKFLKVELENLHRLCLKFGGPNSDMIASYFQEKLNLLTQVSEFKIDDF